MRAPRASETDAGNPVLVAPTLEDVREVLTCGSSASVPPDTKARPAGADPSITEVIF